MCVGVCGWCGVAVELRVCVYVCVCGNEGVCVGGGGVCVWGCLPTYEPSDESVHPTSGLSEILV